MSRFMTHTFFTKAVFTLAICVPALLSPAAAAEVSDADLRKLKQELADILGKQDGNRMSAFVSRVAGMDDPGAAELLIFAAVMIPSAQNYDTAVKSVSRYSRKETLEALSKIVTDERRPVDRKGDYRHRVLVLEGFGLRKDKETREAIYKSLDDKFVHVQVAALRACVSRKEKEAVPVLIDLLEKALKERDRVFIETRSALLELTGEDFDAIEDWRNYWAGNKDTLDPSKIGQEGGPTARPKVKKADDSVEFFGAEILSQNVVFVIDCSGSMLAYDSDPDYSGKNIEYDRQRLTRAKEQCLLAVRRLRGRSRFNIIAYNSRVFTWQKTIVPAASNVNRNNAAKFINGFQANQLTHTDEALEKAFEDPFIDTIVLLSDGAPFKENAQDHAQLIEKILKRVKDLNASRKLRIDTFGFEGDGKMPRSVGGGGGAALGADSPMVQFLKQLASENGGEYRPIK